MFIASQLALKKLDLCKESSITSYSLVIGLVTYAIIYFYILFYKPDLMSLFNNFIIYIIGLDMLLATFYYTIGTKEHSNSQPENELGSDTESDLELDLIENITDADDIDIENDIEDDIEEDIEDDIEEADQIEEVVENLIEEPSEQNAFEKDLLDTIERTEVKKRGRKKKVNPQCI